MRTYIQKKSASGRESINVLPQSQLVMSELGIVFKYCFRNGRLCRPNRENDI